MTQLEKGDRAPEFEALNDRNEKVKLSDFRGKKVLLYFYPKDDTSGCTAQACALRDVHPQVEEENALILGVSPDGVKSHQKFRKKHDLPFQLLVDSDHAIAEAYGVWGEKSMYGRKYMGIIRSQFLIDEEGSIVSAHYKISPKKSAETLLSHLEAR